MSYQTVFAPNLFQGQTIIVTGGGSGIGRCAAHELAALGANIVIIGRNLDKLQNVRAEIVREGGEVMIQVCDIRDEQNVIDAIDSVVNKYGGIQGLVNNAGGQYRAAMKNISTRASKL